MTEEELEGLLAPWMEEGDHLDAIAENTFVLVVRSTRLKDHLLLRGAWTGPHDPDWHYDGDHEGATRYSCSFEIEEPPPSPLSVQLAEVARLQSSDLAMARALDLVADHGHEPSAWAALAATARLRGELAEARDAEEAAHRLASEQP